VQGVLDLVGGSRFEDDLAGISARQQRRHRSNRLSQRKKDEPPTASQGGTDGGDIDPRGS
jgi:hypothetical protein